MTVLERLIRRRPLGETLWSVDYLERILIDNQKSASVQSSEVIEWIDAALSLVSRANCPIPVFSRIIQRGESLNNLRVFSIDPENEGEIVLAQNVRRILQETFKFDEGNSIERINRFLDDLSMSK